MRRLQFCAFAQWFIQGEYKVYVLVPNMVLVHTSLNMAA